jgi:hypothetical protein
MNKSKKHEYEVSICRVGYAHRTISIVASSVAEATKKADEEAGDLQFSEHDAEFKYTARRLR